MSAKKVEPISRPYFRSQVLRLAATNYFPSLDEGVKELVDSLMRVSAGDGERAQSIINEALKSSATCPTPATFEAISSELGPRANSPRGCEKCEGTGMRYVSKTHNRTTLDADGEPYVYESYQADCQQRCDCSLGQFLKMKDKEAAAAQRQQREPNPLTTALHGRRPTSRPNSETA
jgi:hypothetical protein